MITAVFSGMPPQTRDQIHYLIYTVMLGRCGQMYCCQCVPKSKPMLRFVRFNDFLNTYLQYDTSYQCIYRWCENLARGLKTPQNYASFAKYRK